MSASANSHAYPYANSYADSNTNSDTSGAYIDGGKLKPESVGRRTISDLHGKCNKQCRHAEW